MARVIRARYENGVLKPLEKLDLEEGEEVIVRIERVEDRVVERLWGIAKRRRPSLTKEEFLRVLEEIEDEDIRRY